MDIASVPILWSSWRFSCKAFWQHAWQHCYSVRECMSKGTSVSLYWQPMSGFNKGPPTTTSTLDECMGCIFSFLKMAVSCFNTHLSWNLFGALQLSVVRSVYLMVFGVLSRPFLVFYMKLFCETYLRGILLFVFLAVATGQVKYCSGRWSFFPVLDMVELDGGQRANSLGLMVHQAIKCKLHIFFREWGESSGEGKLVGWGGGCEWSGISTALGIQARQRRLANPLSPTL